METPWQIRKKGMLKQLLNSTAEYVGEKNTLPLNTSATQLALGYCCSKCHSFLPAIHTM